MHGKPSKLGVQPLPPALPIRREGSAGPIGRHRKGTDVTVVVDGQSLTLDSLLGVARRQEQVVLEEAARERMQRSRAVVEEAFARGEPVYGLTTGFGVQKRVAVDSGDVADFNRRQLHEHAVGQGDSAAANVVRATMLCLVNAFAAAARGCARCLPTCWSMPSIRGPCRRCAACPILPLGSWATRLWRQAKGWRLSTPARTRPRSPLWPCTTPSACWMRPMWPAL